MTKFREISISEFKCNCLEIIEHVNQTKMPVVITKRGKPVARLVAVHTGEDLFGCMKGSVKIVGDIISPIEVEWESND